MLNRRLDLLNPGLVEGMIRGLAKIAGEKARLGTEQETQAEIDRFSEFTGYELDKFATGVLSSARLNQQFERIFLALSALYRHLTLVGQSRRTQTALNGSDQDILEQGVVRLLEDLRVFKMLKLNTTWNDIRIVGFRDGRNETTSSLRAEVDSNTKRLTQKIIRRTSATQRSGVHKPAATVEILSEGTVAGRSDHGPQKAIDPDSSTFWAEVLLSDRPILTEYAGTEYEGFVAQLTVDLKQLELSNTIKVKPFGLYPVRILNLEISVDGITYETVPSFVESDPSLTWTAVRFDPAPIRFVRLTLLQENYRSQEYLVPKNVLANNQIFQNIADDELRLLLGNRDDSEFETRLADFDGAVRLQLDGLGKLDNKVRQLALSPATASPAQRLALLASPIVGDVNSPTTRLLKNDNPEDRELISFRKAEYILGAQHLEVSFVEFLSQSNYTSPTFALSGTLFEAALEVDENAVSLIDSGFSYPAGVGEYELEIAPFRTVPIVPYGTTEIYEVVQIDPVSRRGFVRFDTTTATPDVLRNGVVLEALDFVFTPADRMLEVTEVALIPGAAYLIKYVPSAGQDVVDIRSIFSSFPVTKPERFQGTDLDGKLRLSGVPFVNYDVIYNEALFYRPSQEAKFFCRRDAGQFLLDGILYGTAESVLSGDITEVDTTIPVTAVTGFFVPTTDVLGELRIEDEIITYTSIGVSSFEGCTRGAKGTSAVEHVAGTLVTATGSMFYEPLEVFVDGVRARNLTDYERGEHPAFSPEASGVRVRNYIQAGANLYFASAMDATKVVEVRYNLLSQYVKVRATMRSTVPGRRAHTLEVAEMRVLMNTAEI